ncbi:MAG: hypothetical protein JWM73_1882, partial [Solirubrobacterales bacterium]|nr:hypothetical protein [Solirubrobacterales bacterium]
AQRGLVRAVLDVIDQRVDDPVAQAPQLAGLEREGRTLHGARQYARRMRSHRVLLLALVLVGVAAPSAGAKTFDWLCRPGIVDNPCTGPLTATAVDPAGNVLRTERTPVTGPHAIDCFYVYPTVSSQPTVNADLSTDPEQIAIAQQQAQRFKQRCRIFAPIYRQLTINGIFDPTAIKPANRTMAYNGVRDAWRSYLRNDNHGRGFVLVGHSQGSFVLRQLITEEIDKNPAVRKRMVSAILLGGNVLVKKGQDTGGDFQNVPACRSETQIGCVVAYSMFNATPPADSTFGRAPAAQASKLEVLCTNPANLAGGSGVLDGYVFNKAFPGTLGIAVNAFIGPLPDVSTPWIIPPGRYTARCSSAGGADVLHVTASKGARDFVPSPNPGWGWHLADGSLALGNLTRLVARQAAVYAARS